MARPGRPALALSHPVERLRDPDPEAEDLGADGADVAAADTGPPSVRGGYRATVLRWVCASVAASILSGFAFLLLTGQYSNDGPTVAEVTPGRGLHAGDVVVLAGWAVGMLAIALLLVPTSPRRRADRR